MPSNAFFFEKIVFNKKENLVTLFLRKNGSVLKKRVSFFPRIRIASHAVNPSILKKVIGGLNFECVFLKKKHFVEIIFRSFREFEDSKNVFARLFRVYPVYLEPERQFLLLNNLNLFSFVKSDLKQCSALIQEENRFLKEMITGKGNEKKRVLKKMVFSSVLGLSFEKITLNYTFFLRELLKNACFVSGSVIEKPVFFPRKPLNKISVENASIVSLEQLILFDSNFFQCSPELLNCNCCKPEKIGEENLLFNSLVEVNPLISGLYHLTENHVFAFNFHSVNSGKRQRELFGKEYGLRVPPIGPLFEEKKVFLPLYDALTLFFEKKCVFTGKKFFWHCKKMPGKQMFLPWLYSYCSKIVLKALNELTALKKELEPKTSCSTTLNCFFENKKTSHCSELVFFNEFVLSLVPLDLLNPLLASNLKKRIKSFNLFLSIVLGFFNEFLVKQKIVFSEVIPFIPFKTRSALYGLYLKHFYTLKENASLNGFKVVGSKGVKSVVKGNLEKLFEAYKKQGLQQPLLVFSAKKLVF